MRVGEKAGEEQPLRVLRRNALSVLTRMLAEGNCGKDHRDPETHYKPSPVPGLSLGSHHQITLCITWRTMNRATDTLMGLEPVERVEFTCTHAHPP